MYSEEWKKDANPEEFWVLIELAQRSLPAFVEKLKSKDRRGLIRFAWLFEEFVSALGREPYQQYTDPTLSEDALDDLWEEVVGRGRRFYEDVVNHPERMPRDIDHSDPSHRIKYETTNVFYERFGEEIPPYGYDY